MGSTSNTPDVSYSQENRLLSIDTPLGKDVLLLQELSGHEGTSRLFSYELDLLAYDNDSIAFEDIVGQNVTMTIHLPDGSPRYINGYVSRFTQGATDERYFTHYHAQVVPWLWFLTRQADCRIFQNMKPPDIITAVLDLFSNNDYRTSLQGDYPTLEYCVQYRETSFNFVSRLMEQYGIFYYFDHTTEGQHTMVLADQSSGLPDCPGSPVSYDTQVGGLDDPAVVSAWHLEQEVRTGKYTVTDYNFITPSTSLLTNNQTVVELAASQDLELYDYPGIHTTKDDGDAVAKLRMQEEETSHKVIEGASTCRGFMSGYSFELQNHYRDDQNATYVLTEVQHFASAGDSYTAEATGSETYSNQFTCIASDIPYRPPRLTPKPFVQGPQTALVVGKQGEEIWVDKYGRVIVQFYWDRLGQKNENSSCWIRTSQPWAGGNWGAMWIPRIGQEVIVSFLEGDPDRPIITGRVYNAEQMPPYELPEHQTVSTFQSRSSKSGSTPNYNEIRFEDKQGNEQIFINAERDMDQRVEVDSREFVGSNRHLIVGANQTEDIGTDKHITVGQNHVESIGKDMSLTVGNDLMEAINHDQHLTVGNNVTVAVANNVDSSVGKNVTENVGSDMHVTIGNNRTESVASNQDLTVGSNRTEQIGGNQSLTVSSNCDESIGSNYALTAGQNITLQGGVNVVIQAGMQLTLTGPGGFITIGPSGVAIQGTMVLINSGGAAGTGSAASPQSPNQPQSPQSPKAPDTPKAPEIADDGSKFMEIGIADTEISN